MLTRFIAVALVALAAPLAASAQTETVTYFHTDAIGSVRMITDANQQELARYDFVPFGADWPSTSFSNTPNQLKFVGKERDPETSATVAGALDYFGARHYQSLTGRFTTVDPVLDIDAATANPQRWNRYAYALNNPLGYVDPDGALPVVLPVIYAATAFAASPAGQRAIIAGSRILSRYGAQLQSFAWTSGTHISTQIFTRVGPALTGRLAETLRGASEAWRNTRIIDNFVNGTAISIKTLDILARTYQDPGRLASRLIGYVDQLASYTGGNVPGAVLRSSDIERRVLEIILPNGTLSFEQLQVLGRIQQEAARRGVHLVYFQTK